MPTSLDALLRAQRGDLDASLQRLRSSYERVKQLPRALVDLSDLEMETWEAYVSRFARAADLFLAKYLRTFVLVGDPAFRGSLRDFVNQAEKLGLVADAAQWMAVRELRNAIAHEYSAGGLAGLFGDCLRYTPMVLAVGDKLELSMRLGAAEIAGIVAGIEPHLDEVAATLFLYGSRVSDSLKGGDIDLILLCEAAAVPDVREKKYEMLADIKARIGDQRIDLSVVDPAALQGNAFWRAGAANRIELYRWPGRDP